MRQTPTTATLMGIPTGDAGTRKTLKIMSKLVRRYKTALPIRMTAVKLAQSEKQKDWVGEVKKIHAFVRDHVRYIKDVRGVETLQTPIKTLEFMAGDCDDKATLLAAMLESINHPTRFIAVGFGGPFSHVYVETKIGNQWIPLETTEPVEMGWSPKNVKTRMRWHN